GRFDGRGPMGVESEAAPEQPVRAVQRAAGYPDPPRVARVEETVPAEGVRRGEADEGLHVRVAADDAVEGDEVGRRERRAQLDEVPGEVGDPIAESRAVGLTL